MKLNKLKKYNKNVDTHGITLIALVITIVILIILASVAINMTLGENGIFNKAKVANKAQVIAEAKEKIGTDILAAQLEAIARDESLEEEQVKDIISNYGELQEDGDTIILKDIDEKVSLLDIYNGTTVTSGSYLENKAKIELLETQVAKLEQQLEDSSKSESEKSKELSELKQSISDAKTLIATAITEKGVETAADATFETMSNNIRSIITENSVYTLEYGSQTLTDTWAGGGKATVSSYDSNAMSLSDSVITFKKSGTLRLLIAYSGSSGNVNLYSSINGSESKISSSDGSGGTLLTSISVSPGTTLCFYAYYGSGSSRRFYNFSILGYLK